MIDELTTRFGAWFKTPLIRRRIEWWMALLGAVVGGGFAIATSGAESWLVPGIFYTLAAISGLVWLRLCFTLQGMWERRHLDYHRQEPLPGEIQLAPPVGPTDFKWASPGRDSYRG